MMEYFVPRTGGRADVRVMNMLPGLLILKPMICFECQLVHEVLPFHLKSILPATELIQSVGA